ncbi:DUF2061 domain-containing protein [Haloflavibacter putidus]|uniref:DUF2061 domain-containing protein n=1 Tax=Haloflavibacter putidus TaxID=2576776 RepID=A0A507ZTL2_9FLAO|nr:DUF2061 domain-containing protein [Haloflavibacter putidus]TQD40749.1 DUF2061 domain-containing protein [Haloflavibacter putidus]
MNRKISQKRHIAKTITWRVVGTIDTILITWLVSGDIMIGLGVGSSETISKIILYYLHERLWVRVNLKKLLGSQESKVRHITKTITWRIIGTTDTIILAWVISGNPYTGLKVGFIEVISKMLLYYLHERAWYKIDYGLKYERSSEEEEAEKQHEH